MDTIDVNITDTNKDSNDLELYENLKLSSIKQIDEPPAKKIDEEHYETLNFEGAQTAEVKTDIKDNNLNGVKVKIFIYSILGSIFVLYVAVIALIISIFVPKAPVDGLWASWASWTSCDVTCGNGTILRTRRCTNPVPTNIETDCIGESLQSSICFKDNCPVDGQWTNWSSWTSCDVTCGKGTNLRTRRCTNPAPTSNGNDCIGETLQSSQCLKDKCPAIISAFSVKKPHTYSIIDNIYKLNFSSIIYQYGSDFNISTGTFTCRLPGIYQFSATLVKKRASTRVDLVQCYIRKNSQSLISITIDPTDDETDYGSAAVSQSIVIDLDIGDTVYLSRCIGQPDKYMESWTSFTGFLLYHID